MEKELKKRVVVRQGDISATLGIAFYKSNSITKEGGYDVTVHEYDSTGATVNSYYTFKIVDNNKKNKYEKAFVEVADEYVKHLKNLENEKESLNSFHNWNGEIILGS